MEDGEIAAIERRSP